MGRREGLVPKAITDKRGRSTTVYVRSESSNPARSMPPVKLSGSSSISMTPSDIVADCKQRIQARYTELSGDMFTTSRYNMDTDDFVMATKLVESSHAGKFMPSVVLQGRINPLGKKELKEWLTVMSRHFDDLMSSGVLRGTERDEIAAADFIGAIPRLKYLECMRRGMKFKEYCERVDEEFTPEQELHLALLTASAWYSDMDINRNSSNGQHGPTQSVDDHDLLQFAFNGATREQVDAACAIMKRGVVTRFTEVEALMNGNTMPAVAEGWL